MITIRLVHWPVTAGGFQLLAELLVDGDGDGGLDVGVEVVVQAVRIDRRQSLQLQSRNVGLSLVLLKNSVPELAKSNIKPDRLRKM
jgi:hypothetical protein